jgi:hypothetical protein
MGLKKKYTCAIRRRKGKTNRLQSSDSHVDMDLLGEHRSNVGILNSFEVLADLQPFNFAA